MPKILGIFFIRFLLSYIVFYITPLFIKDFYNKKSFSVALINILRVENHNSQHNKDISLAKSDIC